MDWISILVPTVLGLVAGGSAGFFAFRERVSVKNQKFETEIGQLGKDNENLRSEVDKLNKDLNDVTKLATSFEERQKSGANDLAGTKEELSKVKSRLEEVRDTVNSHEHDMDAVRQASLALRILGKMDIAAWVQQGTPLPISRAGKSGGEGQ